MQQGTWPSLLFQEPSSRIAARFRTPVRAAWALLLLVAAPLGAQEPLPRPVGYVNDFADVIPPEAEQRIQRVADEVRSKSGGEIVVVTLPSLEGRPVDEVALRVLREWGIGASTGAGDPRNNTGALILVVPAERQWKIELGYGTNTFVTAAEAGRLGRELMVPAFRQGDYGAGILAGTVGLAQEYAEQFEFELTGEVGELPQTSRARRGPSFNLLLVIAIILFFLFANRGGGGRGGGRGRRLRRGGPVIIPFPMGGGGFGGGGFGGGGFGGGGFGGFGGGGGGGGGAGGGW